MKMEFGINGAPGPHAQAIAELVAIKLVRGRVLPQQLDVFASMSILLNPQIEISKYLGANRKKVKRVTCSLVAGAPRHAVSLSVKSLVQEVIQFANLER